MSWQYQIALECADNEEGMEACVAFFQTLAESYKGSFVTSRVDFDRNPWVCLNFPENQFSESDWLAICKRAWPEIVGNLTFRYAICGLEVEHFRTWSELLEEGHEGFEQLGEVALSKRAWESLGSPSIFRPYGLEKYVLGELMD